VRELLLLNCRCPFLDNSRIYPPLAHLYLKSYVNQHAPGIRVTLGGDDYSLANLDWCEPYDAIGISIMTPQRIDAMVLAQRIKHRWPTKIVIAGGPHVRHYLAEILRHSCFDYLVPADGEQPLVQIATSGAGQRVLWSTMTRQEIATQPRPDRSSDGALAILRAHKYLLGGRSCTTMMTARGCPERCAFCEGALTTVRKTSLANIERELDDIAAAGFRAVYIFDDVFALSPFSIRSVCEALAARDLIYRCNAQARYFVRRGDDMARLLRDTGCHEIAFGAESGSQRILDAVGKRCTVQDNYRTVAVAKRYGLVVKAFILLGLPGEDRETLRDTEAFVRDSGIDDFQLAVYMPYKGTEIRDRMDRGDLVDLSITSRERDGEISGAYGVVGGETRYEVSTKALSSVDLRAFRQYLVRTYRPLAHANSRDWPSCQITQHPEVQQRPSPTWAFD
jgi:anaerobic magnesium-protoporphyrin IX monomethyl ester cyclase